MTCGFVGAFLLQATARLGDHHLGDRTAPDSRLSVERNLTYGNLRQEDTSLLRTQNFSDKLIISIRLDLCDEDTSQSRTAFVFSPKGVLNREVPLYFTMQSMMMSIPLCEVLCTGKNMRKCPKGTRAHYLIIKEENCPRGSSVSTIKF
jgi:hypothetical protein